MHCFAEKEPTDEEDGSRKNLGLFQESFIPWKSCNLVSSPLLHAESMIRLSLVSRTFYLLISCKSISPYKGDKLFSGSNISRQSSGELKRTSAGICKVHGCIVWLKLNTPPFNGKELELTKFQPLDSGFKNHAFHS